MENQTSTILIIDDDENVRTSFQALLSLDGYSIIQATNGEDGLNILSQLSPDVILLDILMPQMDGIETCRRIRSNPAWNHIPIIMVTALNSKQDTLDGLAAGADEFLSKPVDGGELRARVKSMLRIKHQYDALQELIHLRDDLENMLVHDLRSPLMIIMGACENLLSDALTEQQKKWAEKIKIQSHRLNNQMTDMLLLAKMEENHLSLSLQATSIHNLLSEIEHNHQQLASAKKITLEFVKPSQDINLMLDLNLIIRVFDNLVSNAIKYSPSNAFVQIFTREHKDNEGDWFQICVADQGQGIPPEFREKIFDKFEIINLKKNLGFTQIGLGLAFCKLVIDAHKGRISVTDNEPYGSLFIVDLRKD